MQVCECVCGSWMMTLGISYYDSPLYIFETGSLTEPRVHQMPRARWIWSPLPVQELKTCVTTPYIDIKDLDSAVYAYAADTYWLNHVPCPLRFPFNGKKVRFLFTEYLVKGGYQKHPQAYPQTLPPLGPFDRLLNVPGYSTPFSWPLGLWGTCSHSGLSCIRVMVSLWFAPELCTVDSGFHTCQNWRGFTRVCVTWCLVIMTVVEEGTHNRDVEVLCVIEEWMLTWALCPHLQMCGWGCFTSWLWTLQTPLLSEIYIFIFAFLFLFVSYIHVCVVGEQGVAVWNWF